MSSQQQRQQRAPWQNEERHYCPACNAWMGSDRQSIMLHENGKKHMENVERLLQEKRINKQQQEKAQKFLADSLKQMEQAALAETGTGGAANSYSNSHNIGNIGNIGGTRPLPPISVQSNNNYNRYPPPPPHHSHNHLSNHRPPPPLPHHSHSQYSMVRNGVPPPPPPPPPVVSSSLSGPPHAAPPQPLNPQPHANYMGSSNYTNSSQLQQEKIDWQAQKLVREEINNSKRKKRGDDDDDDDKEQETTTSNKRPKIAIRPDEGHYTYDDINKNCIKNESDVREKEDAMTQKTTTTTYLEGTVFFGLLEEDMSVQVWIGSSCCRIEKQLPTNLRNWKNALVMAVVNRRPKTTKDEDDELQRPTVHVSYLSSPDDTEETIEKKVSVDRIRIILGGDDKIPDSLEEARLLAMGGEEIHVTSNKNGDDTTTNNQQQDIDEATGLSGWSTVTIKKTTHRQQHREERERFVERKNQAAQQREAEQKRVEARRLEEAKASNADDSALGAYDVWGKMDYKGVDISKEIHCSVEDTAKRLAPVDSASLAKNATTGGKIAFKKRVKKKGARAARRRTSADDDD